MTSPGRPPHVYVWAWTGPTSIEARLFYTQDGAVLEDPATGSACANLGGWLVHQGSRDVSRRRQPGRGRRTAVPAAARDRRRRGSARRRPGRRVGARAPASPATSRRAARRADMPTWVGFLRAVNVGKRQVKMQTLRELLQDNGFDDVETHIQSGNLKVRCATRSAARVEAGLRTLISAAFGFDVPVVVRTPAQLRRAGRGGRRARVADRRRRPLRHVHERRRSTRQASAPCTPGTAETEAARRRRQRHRALPRRRACRARS